jgi:hypothetical protein
MGPREQLQYVQLSVKGIAQDNAVSPHPHLKCLKSLLLGKFAGSGAP